MDEERPDQNWELTIHTTKTKNFLQLVKTPENVPNRGTLSGSHPIQRGPSPLFAVGVDTPEYEKQWTFATFLDHLAASSPDAPKASHGFVFTFFISA